MKKSILIALATALALFLSASLTARAEPKPGGTLVWISGNTPRHLNPSVQSGIATAMPGTQIFATPLRFDENWNPHPYLDKNREISDDKQAAAAQFWPRCGKVLNSHAKADIYLI